MPRLKGETLSIRTSPDVKELLRLAARREHRSVASMVEVLVLEYARKHASALMKSDPLVLARSAPGQEQHS
jgi:uncharacterized protein (DUF1778 family)